MAKIDDIRDKTPKRSSTRSERDITTIVRHHSATNSGDFWTFWNNRWRGLGWQTGGYHEIILRDGTVQLCYDPSMVTNGAGGQNSYTYHICIVGIGNFTELQEQVFEERCHLALKRFNLKPDDVKGHGELPGQSTQCPGIDMDSVRERLAVVLPYPEATVIYQDQQVHAYLIEGRTMVQIRDLANILGVQIGYDGQTRTTTFHNQVVTGKVIDGRTYMHVREAAAIVGLTVEWNQQTREVTLS